MKRLLALTLIVCFLLAFAGCHRQTRAKREIFDLVAGNYDAILTACENKDTETLLAIEGITAVKATDGYILVYCTGAGIAPSSQDYGFYYTEENRPVAVDCNLEILCDADALVPEGAGYQFITHGNVFYTEQIKGAFYYYSAAY